MKIEIDGNAKFGFPSGYNTYKLKGLYFESENEQDYKDVITDFDNNPIAFVKSQHVELVDNQPNLEEIIVKRFKVAFLSDSEWQISDGNYESIKEFYDHIGMVPPAYLLKED